MNSNSANQTNPPEGSYQVVARKYRPQSFQSLIGQGHIATALSNAINQSRVGHAYLFTGARGVGKTSSARIFAKCLNCEKGPTTEPCDECDSCKAISVGEDVDVLEIDGASNRGIDEIRSLRSNAAIRPSRSRFKIYIIDEVHMLTMQAFNALLKTLEEPPRHVKFIFCTTDPHKIPITVLSRCQRFDFSPVQTAEIAHSLKVIAEKEGKKADDAALELLARRANGSMRDSQSLLEQIFSFCGKQITVNDVHQLLGTADIGRVLEIANAMLDHNPSKTLELIHEACATGVDPGLFSSQLLGFFRDLMAVKVNCHADTLLTCSISDLNDLQSMADRLGLETILTIVQILDATLVRMQSSLHARTLIEVAAVRICELENLESISDLIKQLGDGAGLTMPRPAPVRSEPLAKLTKPVDAKAAESSDASKKKEVAKSLSPKGSAPLLRGSEKTTISTWPPKGQTPLGIGSKSEVTETGVSESTNPIAGSTETAGSSNHSPDAATFDEAISDYDQATSVSTVFNGSEDQNGVEEDAEKDEDATERPELLQTFQTEGLQTAATGIIAIHPAHVDQSLFQPAQISSGKAKEVVGSAATVSKSTRQIDSSSPAFSTESSIDHQGVQSMVSASTQVLPDAPAPAAKAISLRDVDPVKLKECWNGVAESLGGMTTDMIIDPELLEVSGANRMIATLKDDYTVKECLKPERKQKIEQRISEALGFRVIVDFAASKVRPQTSNPTAPRLSRSQQIRILMDQEIVKQAAQIFTAEVTNFFQPPPKKVQSESP